MATGCRSLGFKGHSYAYYQNLENNSAGIAGSQVDLRRTDVGRLRVGHHDRDGRECRGRLVRPSGHCERPRTPRRYSTMAAFATVIALVAIVLTIVQLREHPRGLRGRQRLPGMAYTAYDSAILAIAGSGLVHLVILAFLGLGLTIRSSRGSSMASKLVPGPAGAVFLGLGGRVLRDRGTPITTTINTIH